VHATVGDRRVDVHRVDIRVFQELAVVGMAVLDSIPASAFLQLFAIAPADRRDFRAGVFLIDRDEFGPEAEADNSHADRLVARHFKFSFERVTSLIGACAG
jgi:hypothetical protein